MKKIILKNKAEIFLEKNSSPTVTVQANVKVGSAFESRNEAGFSHFVEHMVFEGTRTRTNFQIANEIERIGGELNGATTSDRTFYYAKVPKKYCQKAVDIMADIMVNASFDEKTFKKEKTVILSEIDMFHDDPKLYQWTLLEKNLFSSSLKNPTAGSKESIKKCTRSQLFNYYKKHYTAGNIFFTIAGDFGALDFSELEKLKEGKTRILINEKALQKDKTIVEKRKIQQSYIIIGFKTIPKTPDSAVFDVIHAILGRGASGKMFDEIRNKRGLGYSVHVFNELGKYSGFFGVAVSTKKEKLVQVKEIVLNEIKKLENIEEKEICDAKEYVLGKLEMDSEDTKNLTDYTAVWNIYSSVDEMNDYKEKLKKVTKKEIINAVKAYFARNVTAIIREK